MLSKKSTYQPDLSIVIPARREAKRIGKTLDELAIYLKKDKTLKNLTTEVLVVAADAGDDTGGVTLSKKNKFENLKLLKPGAIVGKGRDVAYGMLRAKGNLIIFMDADLATPLRHLAEFYNIYQRQKPDIIIATRNLRKHHPGKTRIVISNIGNILFRFAGGVWVEDSQCGFKMFTHEAAKICFKRLTILGWGFDMEILAIAKAQHLRICTRRVNDWVSVPDGVFADGVLKSSTKSLVELSRILSNRIVRRYR